MSPKVVLSIETVAQDRFFRGSFHQRMSDWWESSVRIIPVASLWTLSRWISQNYSYYTLFICKTLKKRGGIKRHNHYKFYFKTVDQDYTSLVISGMCLIYSWVCYRWAVLIQNTQSAMRVIRTLGYESSFSYLRESCVTVCWTSVMLKKKNSRHPIRQMAVRGISLVAQV